MEPGGNAAPIALQRSFWNEWNASTRERELADISRDQQRVMLAWLTRLNRTDLEVLEVGCGAGWLCPSLKQFGRVTATDLSDEVLSRARMRVPDVNFIAGDFMTLDFAPGAYDVVVNLEVLSHVADQPAFIGKMAELIRPGGYVMVATQNRPVLERYNRIPPAKPGQLRRWVDRSELTELLSPHFELRELFAITPRADHGPMRFIAGRTAQRLVRSISGRWFERALGATGFGWTLMALAQKPAEACVSHAALDKDT